MDHPGYDELIAAWKALRRTHGIRMREVACVGAPRTLPLVEWGPIDAPSIMLLCGTHGDEPAAPWALHALVAHRLLDDRYAYRIWPCVNPTGYAAYTRANADGVDINRTFGRGGTSPEARAVITANRDRRFELTLDLHEDYEAAGFYAFEPLAPGAVARLAERAVGAVETAGLPIQNLADAAFDLGSPPAARAIQIIGHGTVVVDARAESAFFADGLPFSLFVLRQATRAALTFESPRTRRWDDRIAAHRTAVTAAIAALATIPPACPAGDAEHRAGANA